MWRITSAQAALLLTQPGTGQTINIGVNQAVKFVSSTIAGSILAVSASGNIATLNNTLDDGSGHIKFTGITSGALDGGSLAGTNFSFGALSTNQVLQYNGSMWTNGTGSTAGAGPMMYSMIGSIATTNEAPQYLPITGDNFSSVGGLTQAQTQVPMSRAGSVQAMYVTVTSNGASAAVTFTVQKNGSSQAMTTTFSPAATGTQNDSIHTFAVAPGDLLDIDMSYGTSTGNVSFAITIQID
jgi:hypothetical protein